MLICFLKTQDPKVSTKIHSDLADNVYKLRTSRSSKLQQNTLINQMKIKVKTNFTAFVNMSWFSATGL